MRIVTECDNAGKLEIPYGVEDNDTDSAGVPYFRANDSLVFTRIAKYFTTELENAWHNTEINPIGKAFDSTGFINEFDIWQEEFPEELWRLDYERKYKRTYVGGTGEEWNGAKPQSNKSDIVSTRFLTEMMNGRKKYQRRCFERNQEIYMSSKFKGEVNIGDTITLRGTGLPANKVVDPNFALTITPFSKMYINLYNSTSEIYYHQKCEAGVTIVPPIEYPNTNLDFIYIRGASQIQSLGDLSPMYLQTAELTPGAKLKTITLGNATEGYSNDSLQTLQIGAGNKLLEELDIRNLSGLSNTVLPVTNIPSLKRIYAQGSNITEARFANNGLLEEAYLPETITRLELRNLNYLNTIELESYENLLYLTVMNCSDMMNDLVLDMINQAPDLRELRVTNVNWTFDDTTLLERLHDLITNVNSPEVVLSGTVTVPTIGEYDKQKYEEVWSDLTIIPKDGIIPQYKVTFMNEDGTELDVQYIDQYGNAVNPITREENPISIPTKESTVKYSYDFAGWDKDFTNIIDNINVYATYTESIREYTIQYISMGTPIYTATGKYGTNIEYVGDMPTYTLAEPTTFYLFNRWNKSGFLLEGENGTDLDTGTKTVTAIFDTFQYSANAFIGKDFSELKPVEIYALSRLIDRYKTSPSDYGMNIVDGDKYSFEMGYDIDYDDIDSIEIVSNKKYYNGANYISAVFDGSNYIDTGVKLFDEDRDFVLAVDYKIYSGNSSDGTFMQCFQTSGSHGFKLGCSGGVPEFIWGDASTMKPCSAGSREMIVLRHIKGDNNLYVYTSNLDSTALSVNELTRNTSTTTIYNTTLVFGQQKTDGDGYRNGCSGEITWCKIWYKDLGEDICKKLVGWTHEKISLSVDGFKRYALYDDPTKEVMVSLIADHLLDRTKPWNTSGTTGGWASSSLKTFLNTRFYEAIPMQIKSLMKKMNVGSTIGNQSTSVNWSGCYVTLPSVYDIDTSKNEYKNELYDSNSPISIMQTNDARKRGFDGGDYYDYWTRSPNLSHSSSYVWFVVDGVDDSNISAGGLYGIRAINRNMGVLIEISF